MTSRYSDITSRLLNLGLYQAGWFACVLGAAWHRPLAGAAIAGLFLLAHFCLAADRVCQIQLSLIAGAAGFCVDTLQLATGVFIIPTNAVAWLPPLWMVMLWLQFATTFHYCLHWLSRSYRLTALIAFLGAPLAFFAGERLGAVIFPAPRLLHFFVLGAIWSLTLPTLVFIGQTMKMRSVDPPGYRRLVGDQGS